MALSDDYRIEALLRGEAYRWNHPAAPGTATVVPYAFMDTLPAYYEGVPAENIQSNLISYTLLVINEAHRTLMRAALDEIAAEIPGLKFFETRNPDAAVIRLGAYIPTQTKPVTGAFDASGFAPNNADNLPTALMSGDLWLDSSSQKYNLSSNNQPTKFSDIVIHELGHVIGFKHPGDYNNGQGNDSPPYLPANEDTGVNTVMSYNGDFKSDQLRPYDILAGQFLYGSTAGTTWVLASDGNKTVEGSALNERITLSGGGHTVDAGGGIDVAEYADNRVQYTLTKTDAGWTLAGAAGTDTLTNIERLTFEDSNLALDVSDGNAGTAAKILGAVFGAASVTNKSYMGIGLDFLDGGMSYQDLMQMALNRKLGWGYSNADLVNLIYQNLLGFLPPAAHLEYWTGRLASGQNTPAALAVQVADLPVNATNIDLVGLAQTGIEFSQ